jgi:hypothetical protein
VPAGYEVAGEAETIAAIEQATAAATATSALIAAADMVLPVARILGPNVTGQLAGSYETMHSDPPGVASSLVYAGIVEYGWPARDRPAHLRVQSAWDSKLTDIESMMGARVDDAGGGLGL